jgi:hypothetical protein
MSQRKRNPFSKVSWFFKWRFNGSSLSNVNIASPGSMVTQSQLSLGSPNLPMLSSHTTHPASASTSQLAIPSMLTPLSLQPPPPQCAEGGMISTHLTAPLPGYGTPLSQDLTPRFPIPDPTPSPQPLASRTSTAQPGEHGGFAGAHDFVLNNPQFNDASLKGSGELHRVCV